MPSGITAAIYDDKPVTLRDYLMTVGRQMGYAIHQRDEATSAPVRPVDEPSYYQQQIVNLRQELAALGSMTDEGAALAARADFEKAHREWVLSRERQRALKARYEDMIAQVEAWEPDPLIASTKEYAIKYLRDSIEFDCGRTEDEDRWYPEPVELPGEEWLAKQIASVSRQLADAIEREREDQERTAERNRHIEAFLNSLPSAEVEVPA